MDTILESVKVELDEDEIRRLIEAVDRHEAYLHSQQRDENKYPGASDEAEEDAREAGLAMAGGSVAMTTEERRKRPSHHVVHDYVNLISAGTEIERKPRPPLNSHVQYSFILQYRKFADFFSNKRRRASKKGDIDVLAKDFVSPKIRYKLPEWKKWEAHMNAHTFHITYLRTRNSRPWTGYTENAKMLEEFRREWKRFIDALPDAKKAEFKEEIDLKRVPGSEFENLVLYPE